MYNNEPRPGAKFTPGNWGHKYGVPHMPSILPAGKNLEKAIAKLKSQCVQQPDGTYTLTGTTFRMKLTGGHQ